jgi:imidazolonepropionase-like amidohydrolase
MNCKCLFLVATLAVTQSVSATAQSDTITIHADRALDGTGGVWRNVTISVHDGKITGIRRGGLKRRVTYDLGNVTLLPGLIDAHSHLSWYFNSGGRLHTSRDGDTPAQEILAEEANAKTTLLAGITTVQSPGSPSRDITALRRIVFVMKAGNEYRFDAPRKK